MTTTFEEACANTAAYRQSSPAQTSSLLLRASDILSLLTGEERPNDGIRIYFGKDDNSRLQGYAVGTVKDANGLHSDVNIVNVKKAFPCPSYCPGQPNSLNS